VGQPLDRTSEAKDRFVTDTGSLEILPARTLGSRRWDYVCAAILLLPLVALAFQGDLLQGLAERVNWNDRFTAVHAAERNLKDANEKARQLESEFFARKMARQPVPAELAGQRAQARERVEDLQREVKALREPIDREFKFWNFSFVRHWPLSLLLGPLVLLMLWLSAPQAERHEWYRRALQDGSRWRGIKWALVWLAVFWVGVWQQQVLNEETTTHMGDPSYVAPLVARWSWVLVYASFAGWLAACVYAWAGRPALRRLWAPAVVILLLLVLNYGPMSNRWTYLWDIDPKWGYGYFIGPLAALVLYYKLSESSLTPDGLGGRALADLLATGRTLSRGGVSGLMGRQSDAEARSPYRSELILSLWAAAALVPTAVALYLVVGPPRGYSLLAERFWYYPAILAAALAALAVWQWVTKHRQGDLALRLAGLVLVGVSIAMRARAAQPSIHVVFLQEITLLGVLLGGALAALGYGVFRVVWPAVTMLLLAIPWPERTFVTMAQIPQAWAATMAERFMWLVGYGDVSRDGTTLTVLPMLEQEGRLTVAEQCSGLQMLFAFVTLSVVYAYLSPRPLWRRVIIFVSSFPIAVLANFARVSCMALLYRWGYKSIVDDSLQHEMTGFVVMLPLAFLMLYIEMRVLDLIEWIADRVVDEEPPAAAKSDEGGA